MSLSPRRLVPATLAVACLSLALAGCTTSAGASSAHRSAPTTRPAASSTAPATPTTDPSPDPSATPASPSESSSAASAGHASASRGPAAEATAALCSVAQLRASLADGGGFSGTSYKAALILRNASAATCTLQGWPGVSFVGNGNGTQIGAPAVLERASSHAVLRLRPGTEVQAVVSIVQAGQWNSATCEPRVSDGFRIYPPGSRASLFVGASGSSFEACANPRIQQLSTTALAAF